MILKKIQTFITKVVENRESIKLYKKEQLIHFFRFVENDQP